VEELVRTVGYLNLAAYTALALVALREWRRGRGRASAWAALAFGSLAVVVLAARLVPDDPAGLVERLLDRTVIVLLLLFPYLLYRFSTAFRAPTPRLERGLAAMTIAIAAWTYAAPTFPDAGEPRPGWFLAYLVAFLVHWAVLSVAVAVRLWRAGAGQPSVARRRMRYLAAAATALTLAIFLTASAGGADSALRAASGLVALASALAFLVALAPPWMVRAAWRRPEQERFQRVLGDLMRATTEEEVAAYVLEPMAAMVGARSVALYAAGRLIGVHGYSEESRAQPEQHGPPALADQEPERIDFEGGSLLVWATPYAPFFGGEELSLLRALGDLTGLALDRTRLFAQEREVREALERADAVKSNFVALAAHELRAPVATVHGLSETLYLRAPELSEERRVELRRALVEQTARLRLLVEQLLDLSRLDAEVIPVEPQLVAVRANVQDAVAGALGEGASDVDLAVDPELRAPLDPAVLERIVTNLLVNASRYGAPPITVSAELRDRHFRLTVEDCGPGVPADLVPDLFERFTRGSHGLAAAGGTGLGLAIARSYAQAHDGELLYERGEPHGARFHLVLRVGEVDVEAHALATRARSRSAAAG
jgi:signal transduction histidine kinase